MELLERGGVPDLPQIREHLSAITAVATGYEAIHRPPVETVAKGPRRKGKA